MTESDFFKVFAIAKDLVKDAENDNKRNAAVKKAVNDYLEKEKVTAETK